MEIKAASTYDRETVKALVHLQMFQKTDPQKRIKSWAIIAIIILALIVFDFVAFGSDPLLWMMLGVLAIFTLLYVYMYLRLPEIRYKALGKFACIHNRFVFRENDMSVSSGIDDYQGCVSFKYTMLHKAMETGRHLFIFQNKMNVYIVNKSTIEGGTAEDIRKALAAALGTQYVICKY